MSCQSELGVVLLLCLAAIAASGHSAMKVSDRHSSSFLLEQQFFFF